MPTYRYECQACGHGFELFQSMTEKVRRKCPGCGKQKLERLIGAGAGIIFKGSGFYETDYRSSSYQAGEKAQSDEKPSGTGTPAAGSPAPDTGSSDGAKAKSGPDSAPPASSPKPAKSDRKKG